MSFADRCIVNIPVPYQTGDDDWVELIKYGINKMMNSFKPEVLIVQCGADSLYNDPHGILSISQNGYLQVIKFINSFKKQQIFLGGGGYNELATAKLWTRM